MLLLLLWERPWTERRNGDSFQIRVLKPSMALLEQPTTPKMAVCCMDPSGWFDAYNGCDSAGAAAADAAAMLHAQFDHWPPSGFLSTGDERSADRGDMERHERMLPVQWAMEWDASATHAIQANDRAARDARFERCFQRPLEPNNDNQALTELQIVQQHRHCLGLAPHCGIAFIQRDQGPADAGMLSGWYKRWLVLDFDLGSLTIYKQKDQQAQLDLCSVRAIKRTNRLALSIDFADTAQSSLLLRCQVPSQAELWATLLRLAQQLRPSVDPERTTPSNDHSTMENAADMSDETLVSRQLMQLQLETAACI